jgi:two-component system, OmpR family, sensor histidine kinase MprB
MTLRRRVGFAAAAAVGVAIVLVAAVSYFVVRGQLRGQVDDSLRAQAIEVAHTLRLQAPLPGLAASAGGPAPYAQLVLPDGSHYPLEGNITLPVNAQVRAVAGGNASPYLGDVHVAAGHLREIAFSVPGFMYGGQPVAVQLARPLNAVDSVLSKLRVMLLVLCLGGIALAAALGRLAARRVLAPLADVAATAEHIAATEDLASRIHVQNDEDEVGQLATNFNAMLERLETSRLALDQAMLAQRQLVADASHELRTPVTSLRTNIEVLLADDRLPEDERRRMLADVVEQTEELSSLVGDLIELARGDLPDDSAEEVRLDRVAADAVDRARRNFPHIRFETRLEPAIVEAVPGKLDRALNNLLDNAARHSQSEGVVEVDVNGDGVRVRDHGSGVNPEDLPHVFDRFYRGASARGKQGTGLGLAIVKQAAEQAGGSVSAANAPDMGAIFTMRLPVVMAEDPSGSGWLDDPSLARGPEALA